MPRRNHKKRKGRYVGDQAKQKGLQRPRSFHRGALQGDLYAEAERRFRAAEEGEAA